MGLRLISIVLVALMLGGCSPASEAVAPAITPSPFPHASGDTPAPGDPATPVEPSAPASPAPASPLGVGPPDSAALHEALDNPIRTATAAGDRLIRGLAEASGIAGVLGEQAGTVIDGMIRAEHAAARDEMVRRGLDATTPAAAAGPFRVAEQLDKDAVGGLALMVIARTAGTQLGIAEPDERGHVEARIDIAPSSDQGGIATRIDESILLDGWRCPDPAGVAAATISVEMSLSATTTVDGTVTTYVAQASFAMDITAEAAEDATAKAASFAITGQLTATTAGSVALLEASGAGLRVGIRGGEPIETGVTVHGEATVGGGFTDAAWKTLDRVGLLLAVMQAKFGERHWTSGRCIELQASPPEPRIARAGESLDVDVKAVSLRDQADIDGALTVTPVRGTTSPANARTPATLRITVAQGHADASAGLEVRSVRGIGRTTVDVLARGLKVDIGKPGGMTIRGEKCDGPVGTWHLKVGGSSTSDGFTVGFGGAIDVVIHDTLAGTYTVRIKVTADSLPPQIAGRLGLSGHGHVRYLSDEDLLTFEDGTMAARATASGPGLGLDGTFTRSGAGLPSFAVTPAACGG